MPNIYLYDLDGEKRIIERQDISTDIFRKETECPTEIEICRRLLRHPFRHVVKIYDVHESCDPICPSYIDMEYLETGMSCITSILLNQFKTGLEELHRLDIVYIDIKKDNIGYSEQDRCWKIYDFDGSGIVDRTSPKTWEREPKRNYYTYKKFRESPIEKNLTELDSIILEHCRKNPSYF